MIHVAVFKLNKKIYIFSLFKGLVKISFLETCGLIFCNIIFQRCFGSLFFFLLVDGKFYETPFTLKVSFHDTTEQRGKSIHSKTRAGFIQKEKKKLLSILMQHQYKKIIF